MLIILWLCHAIRIIQAGLVVNLTTKSDNLAQQQKQGLTTRTIMTTVSSDTTTVYVTSFINQFITSTRTITDRRCTASICQECDWSDWLPE